MMRCVRGLTSGALVVASALVATSVGEAHKPITSPFTYNEDVFPILRDRCSACHIAGGVAPMSLTTQADAVPWGESMRAELIAGHMPPWPVETSRDRFRNAGGISARELNVLLTWATGGTPPGDPAKTPAAVTLAASWPLGKPDIEWLLDPVTIGADASERTVSFAVPTGTREARMIRAIDLMPGTASIVRSAQISVKGDGAATRDANHRERLVSLWQPGERPVVGDAAGFELPAGAILDVVVRYKKTWQYERKEMRDQSRVGIYFAQSNAAPINTLALTANGIQGHESTTGQRRSPAVESSAEAVSQDVQVLAVYPDPKLSHVRVSLEVTRPDGSREDVIALRAQPEWLRRYWFKEPIVVPKGSKFLLHVSPLEELGQNAAPPKSGSIDYAPAVMLNVIAAR